MAFKFFDIERHPLLVPEKIDGILTYFLNRPQKFELAPFMPLVTVNADKVEWDFVKPMAGGMTPLVATGSATPIHGGFARGKASWEPAEFREKVLLTELDLVKLRKIGTAADLETGQALLRRKYDAIQQRLQNRMEFMRKQVLFDGAVTAETAEGVGINVPYPHPSYLEPTLTGTDVWSDYANSDPLSNLQEWVEDFTFDTGYSVRSIHLPMFLMRHLQANDNFRTAILYNRPAANGSVGQVLDQLQAYIGLGDGVRIVQSEGQITIDTELTASSGNGDTTLDLGDVSFLKAGDTIRVRRVTDRYAEKFEVDSVSGKTVTVTAGVADATGFAVGDVVSYIIPIVPLDRILIVGQFAGQVSRVGTEGDPDPQFMNPFADVCSTLSGYVNIDNRRPGPFTKLLDLQNQDPPRIEQVTGIKCLPRVHYPDGWMTPKVL